MELIVQPAEGFKPILTGIDRAKTTLDIVIFRFDLKPVEKAIEAAVKRGVAVRALIAHTNSGGEKRLRQLELRMLDAGVTVTRTADDLTRYHGKLMIVDRDELHIYGFNFTGIDLKSRSLGIVARDRRFVNEALRLVRFGCSAPGIRAGHRRVRREPGKRQGAAGDVHQARPKIARHLGSEGDGSADDPAAPAARQGRRRYSCDWQDGEAWERPAGAEIADPPSHPRRRSRLQRSVYRQSEPARARARRPARGRHPVEGPQGREGDRGSVRGGLGEDGAGAEGTQGRRKGTAPWPPADSMACCSTGGTSRA